MSQLVFSIQWNPKEVGSNASEELDVLARREQAKNKTSFPRVLYIGHKKDIRLKVDLPTSD